MLKHLLLATALALPAAPALADTITIGYRDDALGGAVQTLGSTTGSQLQFLNSNAHPLLLGTGFGFAHITALLIPANQSGLGNQIPTFEFAFNDGFVPPQGGTIRLFATWQGATAIAPEIKLPSVFQTNEMPTGNNGLFVNMQIFTCPFATLYCDNYVTGGGTLVGGTQITDQLMTQFPTFAGLAPGSPFSITEEFTFGQDRGTFPFAPQGDVGAAILTTALSAPVPGPIVGAGLPGLIAGLLGLAYARRRRRQQRAA